MSNQLDNKALNEKPANAEFQQRSPRFMSILKELTRIKNEYVKKEYEFYSSKAGRIWFIARIYGTLIIVLSVSLPYLATLDNYWKTTVLPIVALSIAGLTGLNSFFQWQTKWQSYTQTQLAIDYLIWWWELEIVQAKYEPDEEKAIALIYAATTKLLEKTRELAVTESTEYFKAVQLPQIKQG